jgi:hypothetical protein
MPAVNPTGELGIRKAGVEWQILAPLPSPVAVDSMGAVGRLAGSRYVTHHYCHS